MCSFDGDNKLQPTSILLFLLIWTPVLCYLDLFYRPLDRIRGFTRETLIGIIASIETREWRYHFNPANNLPPEHPRSSTTDDVECFFSVLRNCVGNNFTLKQVGIHLITI